MVGRVEVQLGREMDCGCCDEEEAVVTNKGERPTHKGMHRENKSP